MKKTTIIIITIILVAILIGFFVFFGNNSIMSKNANSSENSSENYDKSGNSQNILNELSNTSIPNNTINTTLNVNESIPEVKEEREIASFSTNLKGDSARLNNISITCNTINGTTINPGETFSFNKIVGQPSADKGYQEADVFVNKKTEKGFGGGNCQVSTTIYNAALKVDGISITERNPHKKKVSYIEEGKDAAVSYSGGLDLKFQNNTDKTLKIYVSSDNDSVDARITEL